jgi:hypothetical protein
MGKCAHASQQTGLVDWAFTSVESGVAAESGPTTTCPQQIAELGARFVEEGRQTLFAVGLEFLDHVLPAPSYLPSEIGEDYFLRDFVENDLAPWRQMREALLDLSFQSSAGVASEGAEA